MLSRFFTVILKVNIIWLRNLRQVNTLTVVKCKLTCAYLTLFKKLLLKLCNLSSCRSSEHCFRMWCTHVYMRGSVIICEKMPEISAEEDPLTWWRTHETTLPHLVQFAKKYLFISASSSASECVFSALPQDIFVHVKYTSLSCSRLVIFIFKKKIKNYPLNIVAVFFSVVSKMVSNIDIFQGIVSKLEIPVSWQHYMAMCCTIHQFKFLWHK